MRPVYIQFVLIAGIKDKMKNIIKEKGLGFVGEFKKFITRGNVMDLAVGVIIGGAFSKIVADLVNYIITPVISLITGRISLNNIYFILNGASYPSLDEAVKAGAPVIQLGAFISTVINFILTALVIFIIVKLINGVHFKIKKKEEAAPAPAPSTKKCPFCLTDIAVGATRCPNCTSMLDDSIQTS